MAKLDWRTPLGIYEGLNRAVGGFAVDAAGDGDNHLHPRWYGPGSDLGSDALDIPLWLSPAFCNPPYGRDISRWLSKFKEQAGLGVSIVALLPAKTGTQWWADGVVGADVMFLTGRVPFVDPLRLVPSQPNHDSALVFYEPSSTGRVTWLNWKEKFCLTAPSNVEGVPLTASQLASCDPRSLERVVIMLP